MEKSASSSSSSSRGQFQFLDLELPTLYDQEINTQVQKTHGKHYTMLLRQPLLVSILHILKPATNFLDSILLENKSSEKENEVETSNLSEFNSTILELNAFFGGGCLNVSSILENIPTDCWGQPVVTLRLEFSTISELRTLAGNLQFMSPIVMMDEIASYFVQMLDEINLSMEPVKIGFCTASMDILKHINKLSWDAKIINILGCFVFKFLEFLGFLLHGPNQPLNKIVTSLAALKENPISIMGSVLEKFQVPLDQLNSLIKLTLEMTEYIADLTLLSDTVDSKEEHLPTAVYWAILGVAACYIQSTFLIKNGEVALELSNLISNLSYIVNDLKHHCTTCKSQIAKMDANLQLITFFEEAFRYKKPSIKEYAFRIEIPFSDPQVEITELMKRFINSKDGRCSFIDGSTMTKVDVEALKDKAVIFFFSYLNLDSQVLAYLQKVYEELREEDYYKIVWVPLVFKWTEELRHQFEILKLKMPWYIVCYDSPVDGVWYFKGRFHSDHGFLIFDHQRGHLNEAPFGRRIYLVKETKFPFNVIFNMKGQYGGGGAPTLKRLYLSEPQEEDVNQNKPSNGFQGLIAMKRRPTSLAVMDKATANEAMGTGETWKGTKTNTKS